MTSASSPSRRRFADSRIRRTAVALTAASAMTFGAVAVPQDSTPISLPVAAAVETTTPAGAAAQFILKDFTNAQMVDIGGEQFAIEGLLSAAAGGATKEEALPLIDKLKEAFPAYLGDKKAGRLGYALIFTDLIGEDPTNFAGMNVVEELKKLRQADGSYRADAGSTTTAIASAFDQGLIVTGLHRHGLLQDGANDLAVKHLEQMQCQDGGFGWGTPDKCTGDPDPSGVAAQALAAVGSKETALRTVGWFKGAMSPEGGIKNAWVGENSNSTALGAMAFVSSNYNASLRSTQGFLSKLQLKSERGEMAGAIAATQNDFEAPELNSTLRISTAQSGMALAGATYATAKFGFNPVNPDASAVDTATPADTGLSSGSSQGEKTAGIIALVLAILGAIGAGVVTFFPNLLPRF